MSQTNNDGRRQVIDVIMAYSFFFGLVFYIYSYVELISD